MEINKIQVNTVLMKTLIISCLWNEIKGNEFCWKMAFSDSAYKDEQGHVDVFNGSFPCKAWNTKAIINFKFQEGDEESRVIFLSREMLEKIKQKEQNRLPADVTNIATTTVNNIQLASCLEYDSEEYLVPLQPWFSLALKAKMSVWKIHEYQMYGYRWRTKKQTSSCGLERAVLSLRL